MVLERLLRERVALAWLVAGDSAAAVAGAPGRGLSPAQAGSSQRRHRAERAFLAATKMLATVRKLVTPARYQRVGNNEVLA